MALQDIAAALGIHPDLFADPELSVVRVLLEHGTPAKISLHVVDGHLRAFDVRLTQQVSHPSPATYPGHTGSVSFDVGADGLIRAYQVVSVTRFQEPVVAPNNSLRAPAEVA